MTKKQEIDLNFQLGMYAGRYIVDYYLPTTSVDMLKSRKVISTTIGEVDEFERLQKLWWESEIKDSDITKEWMAMTDYRRGLEAKYLPKNLRCHIPKTTPTNMKAFKHGISVALWDCDLCAYYTEIDKIEIVETDKYHMVVNLELQTEWEPWKID